MRFEQSLSVLDDLTAEISEEVRTVGFKVLQGVTLKTPKDTGLATSAWLVGIQNPPIGQPSDAPGAAASAGLAQQAGLSVIGQYPKQNLPNLWIVNNLPYIGRLNDGSSLQAPAKFVEQTIAEVNSGR